jgi:hypothetical protein
MISLRSLSLAFSRELALCAALPILAFAPAAASAQCNLSISTAKIQFEPNETIDITVNGTPGALVAVLVDTSNGPTDIPGIGILQIGFTPAVIDIRVVIPPDGIGHITGSLPCGSPLLGVPLFAQALTFDAATQQWCLSNAISFIVLDTTGACGPCSGFLGDFVWEDLNGNGIQDTGEPGIAGVQMILKDSGNNVIATTTTDSSGHYFFMGLCPGTYSVEVDGSTVPTGLVPSPCGVGIAEAVDSNCSPAVATLTNNNSGDLTLDFGYTQVCDTPTSSIGANFNGTAMAPGTTIWFNAIVKVGQTPISDTTESFQNGKITFLSGFTTYTVNLPVSRIFYSSSATQATTIFDTNDNEWRTTVPVGYAGNVFLDGAGLFLPNGLPGGIKNVIWSGDFTSTHPGTNFQWKWAAAVYVKFSTDNTLIGVKPIDANTGNPYHNSDHAGTPENFKAFVIGGAMGGGGSNFTGSYSATKSTACQ